MKTKILGGIVAIFTISTIAYFSTQYAFPFLPGKESLQIKRLSFIPPTGWTVEYVTGANDSEWYLLRSPDYVADDQTDCELGNDCDVPEAGIEIGVQAGGFGNLYYASEALMREWVEGEVEKCSNCVDSEIIRLDGQAALLTIATYGEPRKRGEGASVGLTINKVQYRIHLNSSQPYRVTREIFESFLQRVRIH